MQQQIGDLQYISPQDATDAVHRVDADADRLEEANQRSAVATRDPGWWQSWFQWYLAWKGYYAEHEDYSDNIFDAPNVYTYAEARGVELRGWYQQAADRGVPVGVAPTPQADEGNTGGLPGWAIVAAIGVAAVIAIGVSKEARVWLGR